MGYIWKNYWIYWPKALGDISRYIWQKLWVIFGQIWDILGKGYGIYLAKLWDILVHWIYFVKTKGCLRQNFGIYRKKLWDIL